MTNRGLGKEKDWRVYISNKGDKKEKSLPPEIKTIREPENSYRQIKSEMRGMGKKREKKRFGESLCPGPALLVPTRTRVTPCLDVLDASTIGIHSAI